MSEQDPQQGPSVPADSIRWSQAGWPAPSGSVQSTIDQMTDQLQTVIAAAERAAEAIRRDAEEQARRHLAEAQRKADRLTAERVGLISELTDDLIRHAANVRDHSEQMVRALEDAINSVTDKLEQPGLSDHLASPASPYLPDGTPTEPTGPPPPAIPSEHDPADPAPAAPPAVPFSTPAPPESDVPVAAAGHAPSGLYTDIVGAPPPPPPVSAPAPVPPRPPLAEQAAGPPQPTPETAAAAASAAVRPDDRPEHVARALDHARRLADAGSDRETIASVLRQLWGVSDPDPIVDRVLGRR
jgi:vacuolar-type H+-ATPase subunit H